MDLISVLCQERRRFVLPGINISMGNMRAVLDLDHFQIEDLRVDLYLINNFDTGIQQRYKGSICSRFTYCGNSMLVNVYISKLPKHWEDNYEVKVELLCNEKSVKCSVYRV